MVYYLLYHSAVGLYECEITDDYIVVDLKDYQLVYFMGTDRLVIRLGKLGLFANMIDVPSYLDVEAGPSTYLFDAIENLLDESVVLYEEVGEE